MEKNETDPDRIKHVAVEQKELEETSGVASVQGTAGGFTGLDVKKENEDEKQRTSLTRRNELVESLMNYVLNVAE